MNRTVNRLLDFIYPAACHLCEAPLTHGRHLCDPCYEKLHYIEAPFCAKCGECYDGDMSGEFICPNCHELDLNFEFARAALHSDGGGRDLVHDFKYMRQVHLADELARLAEEALTDSRFLPYLKDGVMVPVPLYWLRLRKRRFNQSEEICRKLSGHCGLPYHNALQRTRNTQTQTRFSRAKRLENLDGAFAIRSRFQKLINEKPVILVDDVFTTGSTANECAKVLLKSGAQRVAVLSVLRG
ncbi:amidophosphoribosyltransferase [Oceaniferula spumae]|uniref:Amidophosphoribosyltransferase n=1 Tax=Oceaniferula spumae TaxID=2979115 RepID=A0AAT9FQX6_9BACT